MLKDPKGAKEAIESYREVAEDIYSLPTKKVNGDKSERAVFLDSTGGQLDD